jgi:hypothetical protein
MERVERPLIWCKKLPNKALAPEEIVKTLVIQWLEHYKTQSQAPNVALKDYTLDKINLLDISSSSGFEIVAGVKFSIIPAQVPNDWASFPGDTISPNDVWWHLSTAFHKYAPNKMV